MRSPKRLLRDAAIQGILTVERMRSGVAYNPLSRSFQQNPYPTYARLRRKDPVHWSRLVKAWVITRFEDVDAILRDHDRFSNNDRLANTWTPDAAILEGRSLLQLDPPDHTRLRGLVSRAFTPRAITALEPRIQELVDQLLDELPTGSPVDIIERFAYPLPVIVIAEMIGVPAEDRQRFKHWSTLLARTLEPTITREELRAADQASRELDEYFRHVIDKRRQNPGNDLISRLVQAEEEGDRLSEGEMLGLLRLLLAAGNETTTNLIGNGLLALIRNPAEFMRLRENPDLARQAVEELLRYDSPVQTDARTVTEDFVLHGKQIRRGETVLPLIGSANRDPRAFPSPRTLDITRSGEAHIAFGRGIHYCLGAPLARLEGEIAFRAIARRYSHISLAGVPPVYRDQVVLRGLEFLDVVLQD